MESDTSILSKLQSPSPTGIHALFTSHLHPFTPFFAATVKKPLKSSKSKPPVDLPAIRPLAKQFLSFIHNSLSLIPKRLSESPKMPRTSALELFDSYRLCLDCLQVIAPELSGKPHSVQVQRIRYVHCLEHWDLFKEAEAEGLVVLERLNANAGGGLKGRSGKLKARLVPELSGEGADRELAAIVLEVVVTLVKCASKRKSKVEADYWRVISLVNESEPCFKILDAKDYAKFHHFLETNLHIIAVFLVAEIKSFSVDLIREFSAVTVKEYKKSCAQDQIYKVALKICSSLFSQRDELSADIILDVLKHVLDFMAAECKDGAEKTALGFLELVCYCANKCQSATVVLCDPVALYLYRLAESFSQDFIFISSILNLYASGLLGSSSNQLKEEDTEKGGTSLQVLLNNTRLQQVALSINWLNEQFDSAGKEKSSYEQGISHLPYWEALKFFCLKLAEFIYFNRKEIFSEAETASCWKNLSGIHDAFRQYCHIFLDLLSATEREKVTSGDNHKVISVVVVAALMLSFEINQNIKESTLSVKHVISAQWIPIKRLKYLYVSLNNIAVILKSKKRLKEAFKALKMCCKALWNYVVDLCKVETTKSHVAQDDMSEKSIADFVMEASDKVAFLMQLNQEGDFKVNGIIRESIICWSNSENLIATLPTPASLIKEWVKIQYKMSDDTEHEVMLYSLLSSSKEISKRALGKILEEELCAYDEKSYLNPRYSLRMKMKVINVLLEEIYVTKDSIVKKCRVLIQKAKSLRALGLERLDECIQCLSDAVSTLKLIYGSRRSCSSQTHHLLVHAYLLRALYTQEAAPQSMVLLPGSGFLDDIRDALNLCLHPDHCHDDEQYEDMLYLWYRLIDFLSIKGYLEIHPRLYDVVIKLFNKKNIHFAKTLAELWKNKRLSHALCASPVNHMFIGTFSKHESQLCNSSIFWSKCMEELQPLVVGFHHINNEIKQAASDLISSVQMTSCTSFLSSNLYYDLSARLISSGQMIEALAYAKEAHRLRSKLLQQKFEYSVEKVAETFEVKGELIEKSYYGVQTFKVNDFVVTKGSCDYEGCVLTPWNVLSCYLESILQVGFVQEILGNVSEAEMLLQWGRNVAQFQNLPLFEISFSCLLGKLYRKQKLWSLSEKELSSAKKGLADNLDNISCKKCLWMWEISINQQLGDLFLSGSCCNEEPPSPKTLSSAKGLYKLVLDKLNLSDWGTLYSTSEESLANDKSESKVEPRRSRRTKKEMKPASQKQDYVCGHNRRVTRSVHRSVVETHEIEPGDKETGPSSSLATEHLRSFDSKNFSADLQSEIRSLCNKMKCWQCLHGAGECSNLSIFICMNWELVHRKLSLRLLISIGKFSGTFGHVHEAHETLLQSLSIFVSRNSYCSKHSSDSLLFLIESVGKYYPGDALAVERATLLYFICWFIVKNNCYQATSIPSSNRNFCCELSSIGTVRVLSLLKVSFILCRDVPLLLQKVSRLLTAIYVLSTSLEQFSLSSNEQGSESQWASFFHQASLGTQLNQQFLSGIMQKKQSQSATDSEDSSLPDSVLDIHGLPHSLRPAPESCKDLEEFVLDFFQGLPSTPIICISLVSGADASLLKELLHCSPKVQAWILLSHLSSDNQHVVLLPVHEILKEASDEDASSSSVIFNCKDFVKQWQCPWVSSVIDDIAPVFRHVLEGNYYSSSEYFLEYIKENTSLWWTQRNKLNECLCKFLQDMEDLWLGTWKYLLLGIWPSFNSLDSIQKSLSQDEMDLLQLVVTKKCYVGLRSEATSGSSSQFENMMELLFSRMLEMSDNVDQVECINGKPIILVLDIEVQMLPWECLPILRNQEVYRMPSIGSIFATLDRHCENQNRLETSVPVFPLIDPLDSYYLLNPDGDLSRTQVEFENWFKNQDIIEGRIGTVPTVEELSLALKGHDLFIYFGHGSGTQYIPGHEIQKLDGCAATLLLGCSSGSLYLKGSYMPQGAPLSYILAGSPVIVANLWEVTDKDIDRFGKAMLNAWLRERSAASSECAQCMPTKCIHRPRIASFMAQARDACTLGFLIGASPVCYGVPTGIIKRKAL
ncbi:separase isoform X2 [Salvia miltiorrhiza]|uniref:separase isoform X2 n=1 Tax=Salvia miltiorrhiza TaxID=226208 RepID=UPI0025AD1AE0|nr:separase isoform X2 [Salvia miltiorrhiza]